ncbi:MAG: hypothetical protein ACJ8CB_11455 [Ktedonobacteraceae bacterium]
MWVNPANGQVVHGVIHFAAKAYPTNPGDPAINDAAHKLQPQLPLADAYERSLAQQLAVLLR